MLSGEVKETIEGIRSVEISVKQDRFAIHVSAQVLWKDGQITGGRYGESSPHDSFDSVKLLELIGHALSTARGGLSRMSTTDSEGVVP